MTDVACIELYLRHAGDTNALIDVPVVISATAIWLIMELYNANANGRSSSRPVFDGMSAPADQL